MEDYVLLSIPLYILLGEILVRSGSTDKLYRSLADWLNVLPGGLLHTNIAPRAIFSAVSGSSVATAATVATVALPTLPHPETTTTGWCWARSPPAPRSAT